jgi:hypothetical protein
VATLVARNADKAVVALMEDSGGRFCVGVFGKNLAPVSVKMFSHLICFLKKFYISLLCTLNTICKDNAAINCITVHTKRLNLSTLTGHTLG